MSVDSVLAEFTDYIRDRVFERREGEEFHDLPLLVGKDNQFAYVDVEGQEIFLITVERAEIVAAS